MWQTIVDFVKNFFDSAVNYFQSKLEQFRQNRKNAEKRKEDIQTIKNLLEEAMKNNNLSLKTQNKFKGLFNDLLIFYSRRTPFSENFIVAVLDRLLAVFEKEKLRRETATASSAAPEEVAANDAIEEMASNPSTVLVFSNTDRSSGSDTAPAPAKETEKTQRNAP